MKALQNIIRFKNELALCVIVLVSTLLFSHRLGQPDLSMWDEVVHANVIKNLADSCCTPHLLNEPWGANYQDWSNTNIWMHKPLLPFYASAAVYKILDKSVFSIRFPALVLFELLVLLTYYVGKKYFNPFVGLGAVLLLAFNPYSFELVQGRQFSGLGDIGLAFFTLAVIAIVFEIIKDPKTKWFVWFSVFSVLAYFCKGGLALIPFGILGIIVLTYQRKLSIFLKFGASIFFFLIPVGLASLYLSGRFPIEYKYEQHMQLAHLWKDIEGWGRPWDYYLTFYWPAMIGFLLLPWFWFSTISGLLSLRKKPQIFVLALSTASFFILLSFGVSKISNFIYTVVPLTCILIAAVVYDAWEKGKSNVLASLSLSSIMLYVLMHWDFWQVKYHLSLIATLRQRSLVLILVSASLLAGWLVVYSIKYLRTSIAVKILMGIALLLVTWHNTHANWISSNAPFPNAAIQEKLRSTAAELASLAQSNTVVLLDEPELYRSNLYFQFWSSLPTQEIDTRRSLQYWLIQIPPSRPILLISASPYTNRSPIVITPLGYVYRVR
jgi:4-amino-4-deoxy-L-arabinose transferase-like glycosyltransferase